MYNTTQHQNLECLTDLVDLTAKMCTLWAIVTFGGGIFYLAGVLFLQSEVPLPKSSSYHETCGHCLLRYYSLLVDIVILFLLCIICLSVFCQHLVNNVTKTKQNRPSL